MHILGQGTDEILVSVGGGYTGVCFTRTADPHHLREAYMPVHLRAHPQINTPTTFAVI